MQSRAKWPLPPHLKQRSPASSKSSSKYLQVGELGTKSSDLRGYRGSSVFNPLTHPQLRNMLDKPVSAHLGARSRRSNAALRSSACSTRITPVGAAASIAGRTSSESLPRLLLPLLSLLISLPQARWASRSCSLSLLLLRSSAVDQPALQPAALSARCRFLPAK